MQTDSREEADDPENHPKEAEKQDDREKHHDIEHFEISEPSTAAKVTVSVTCLLGFLSIVSFCVLTAAWLYQAATLSGMNGLLWGVLGLGGNLIVVVVFLIVRSFTRVKCPECGRWQKKARFCRACGAQMTRGCPDCGAECGMDDVFCASCGRNLTDHEE